MFKRHTRSVLPAIDARWRFAIAASLLGVLAGSAGPAPAAEIGAGQLFLPERPLQANGKTGRTQIALANQRVVRGQDFLLDVRFETGSGGYFYNPDFGGLEGVPAQLALFDGRKQYVCDLYQRIAGSWRGPEPNSWVKLRPGTYLGKRHIMAIKRLPFGRADLPLGTYYLQLIYKSWFASDPTVADASGPPKTSLDEFRAPMSDLFRSNALRIELVEGPPASGPDPLALGKYFEDSTPANPHDFRPQRDLLGAWVKSRCTLTADRRRVARDGTVALDVRLENLLGYGSIGSAFYNPSFSAGIPQPAELAIFDVRKKYVGDLLRLRGGSSRDVTRDTWVNTFGYVGTTLTITPGAVPDTKWSGAEGGLPPGKYYLQMLFKFGSISSGGPPQGSEAVAGWRTKFGGPDLFRSNIVEIELVERGGGVPPKAPPAIKPSKSKHCHGRIWVFEGARSVSGTTAR